MSIELRKKIIRVFIATIIFTSVITIQGVPDMRQTHQIVFMLSVIALTSLILNNIWMTLFLAWTVFLYAFFKFQIGHIYLSNVFLGSLLYLMTRFAFKRENTAMFIQCFLWFVCANIFFMVLQELGYDFIYTHKYIHNGLQYNQKSQAIGFMGHKSISATLFALAVPILASSRTKSGWLCALLLFIPLYLFKTSLCFIAAFVGLFFVACFQLNKKVILSFVLASALVSLFYVSKIDNIGIERFPQWHMVMKDAVLHPVSGWGLDSFANVTSIKDFRYTQKIEQFHAPVNMQEDFKMITNVMWWDNPHNLYISIFYEFGVIGLVLFSLYMIDLVKKFLNTIKQPIIVGMAGFILVFLLVSLGHFPIFLARMAIFIIPMFSLFELNVE